MTKYQVLKKFSSLLVLRIQKKKIMKANILVLSI